MGSPDGGSARTVPRASLTITVQAGSERFAPAMAIQSPMVSCDGEKVATGNTCTTGGTVQIGGVAEKGEAKTFKQEFMLKGPAADIQLGIQDGPMVTYFYAAAATATGRDRPLHPTPAPGSSAINELRVLCVDPDCAFTRDDPSDWQPLEAGW